MTAVNGSRTGTFISTKEHRRFTEFASAVCKHCYIGLCYGPAGVGKTLSARKYTNWSIAEQLLTDWGPRDPSDEKVYAALACSKSVFFTPTVGGNLRELRRDLNQLISRVGVCIEQAPGFKKDKNSRACLVKLIIVDEADRLTTSSIEYLRDIFDRTNMGLILIGMPGIEKRMARYPQLYSRVGFAHHYRPLQSDEITFVITRHWRKFGLSIDETDFTDSQAIAAIARLTGGNFRLLHRLFVQIDRVLAINELSVITEDVVEAACSTLLIGAN